ncbi:hypothetical protein U9K52_08640 [Chryseobacterium sp. MHB01]|uniref:hypothetical protein n=1 Tax=Chryseobacterium sp. MHB01 TaxID=3109433 RepID=UPI002AFFE34F|nr:hypothetical protein [Chryseobacterium sp. MHB01]MEA1848974.1 hypothetical protein [Chryseobacterium sp. MHB01]
MKTVNSLSGGQTSSYLAFHYPADLEIFSLVCIDSHNAGRKLDKKLVQMANDRLQKYCKHQNEFVATSEDPMILKTMFDLEQLIGREIIWLRGMGWEQMLAIKQAIPNIAKRFCTTIMKMEPIFNFLLMYHSLPVKMRVGYRYDEMERMEKFTDIWRYATHCQFRPKSITWIHRWKEIIWRIGEFVLIENKIFHKQIKDFWEPFIKKDLIQFAPDSNCQNCFWKDSQQLRKNFDANPEIMYWSAIQEDLYGHTFKEDSSMLSISKLGIQLDFNFGTGSGCQAGFCTD